ncbi:MAG: flagellar assembly protein FliW [Paenibacillus lautus]|jgi:flagellar assembly factor FliW|uniref:flagellar assembly protein FliW n=1 Tax=Paenibacillus lautus TaxID=1401 RepID=UPI0010E503D0|nr:flagellar assembly protein FliW [Paenibacillus lautus]MCI1774340.1 flagellar assembly protein FliW [Paenibacillus lautus]VTR39384.1 Flagellar assembly factor FliW [Actinobacillus pleuropneumoniae]
MVVNTKRFGQIEIESNQMIVFESPILGFGDLKNYVLLPSEDKNGPFEFLQSVENENLSFIVTDPFVFFPEYEFRLEPQWIETLAASDESDIIVMVIVTVRSADDISCNLKAPIVINKSNNSAAQIVLDQVGYMTQQPLLREKKGADFDADSVKK